MGMAEREGGGGLHGKGKNHNYVKEGVNIEKERRRELI